MNSRIVIVDDSRAIQAILSRSIQAAGLPEPEVHTFSGGAEALAFVGKNGADLVITDWHMPGMSGLELLQSVRQLAAGRIQVGLVTTESAEDLLGQATRSGAAFILRKPFKDAALQDAVRTALQEGHRAQDAAGPGPAPEATAPAPAVAAPADAAAARRPAEAERLLTRESLMAELEGVLRQHFGAIKFRVVEQKEPALGVFSAQVLLGLISPPTGRAVAALALLDTTVVLMLAGAATLSKPEVVRPLIAAGTPDAAAVEQARRFLLAAAPVLVPGPDEGNGPARVQCSMVPRQLPKLQDSFARGERLRSFKLQVPGYGEGYVAVFLP